MFGKHQPHTTQVLDLHWPMEICIKQHTRQLFGSDMAKADEVRYSDVCLRKNVGPSSCFHGIVHWLFNQNFLITGYVVIVYQRLFHRPKTFCFSMCTCYNNFSNAILWSSQSTSGGKMLSSLYSQSFLHPRKCDQTRLRTCCWFRLQLLQLRTSLLRDGGTSFPFQR